MNWQGPIKAIGVELPEDLHHTVRLEGMRRKRTARVAYTEALEDWLGITKIEREVLTEAEKNFIAPLLFMFREGDSRIQRIQQQIDEWKYEQKQRAEKESRSTAEPGEKKWKKGSRRAG